MEKAYDLTSRVSTIQEKILNIAQYYKFDFKQVVIHENELLDISKEINEILNKRLHCCSDEFQSEDYLKSLVEKRNSITQKCNKYITWYLLQEEPYQKTSSKLLMYRIIELIRQMEEILKSIESVRYQILVKKKQEHTKTKKP